MRGFAERLTSVRPLQDAAVALLMLAALFAMNLPVESYAGFARFRAAGFSGASFGQWLTDTALAWATITPFHVVGIVAIMVLIRARPRSWTAWASGVYLVVSASYVLLAPALIEPLFNELTPLAEGPQKGSILSMARANGVPAADVLVRDASLQGMLLDAHVSGFGGTARIVLDDNTIAAVSAAEVRMVMAHEIGHYVLAHIPKGIVFDALVMALGILLVGWSADRFLARHGGRLRCTGVGDIAALPLLWGSFLLWGYVALPVTNGITRQQEAEADLFGLNASREPTALAEYMIRDADTGQLDPSALEEWVFYGHPSPRHRIEMAMRWRAEQGRDAR
jgi:STE24 endopeptidase